MYTFFNAYQLSISIETVPPSSSRGITLVGKRVVSGLKSLCGKVGNVGFGSHKGAVEDDGVGEAGGATEGDGVGRIDFIQLSS